MWLMQVLQAQGHEVLDKGTFSLLPDDGLVDYVDAACGAVIAGEAERAILLCMSGGLPVVRANRFDGLRAVVGFDEDVLKHDREASDVNVLTLPSHYLSNDKMERLVRVFLETGFVPLERRVKRLERLARVPVRPE